MVIFTKPSIKKKREKSKQQASKQNNRKPPFWKREVSVGTHIYNCIPGLSANLAKHDVSIPTFQPAGERSFTFRNSDALIKSDCHKHTLQYHQERVRTHTGAHRKLTEESQSRHWNKSPGSECQLSRQLSPVQWDWVFDVCFLTATFMWCWKKLRARW